jgi:hypothetical protein
MPPALGPCESGLNAIHEGGEQVKIGEVRPLAFVELSAAERAQLAIQAEPLV